MDDLANQQLITEFQTEKKVPVIEIFGPTIQGEGPMAGSKTMFVRFGGCDFRCKKCDSLHAVDPKAVKKHAERLTQEDIWHRLIDVMEKTGTEWVTLSGGNPCMWDLHELVSNLRLNKKQVAVETQGTLRPHWLRNCSLVVVSPKAPGMGEKFNPAVFSDFVQAIHPYVTMALKVVVFSAGDMEWALGMGDIADDTLGGNPIMKFLSLGNPFPPVLTPELELANNPDLEWQNAGESLQEYLLGEYKTLLDDFFVDRRMAEWRFLPQMHVLVWGNEAGR